MSSTVVTVPEYISKDLFERALCSGLSVKCVRIEDLQITMGSSAGDNYCSDIYRAKIGYTRNGTTKREHISLIVKAMPFTETRGPILEDLDVFEKEIRMYMTVLPKLSSILNGEFLAAKCFYASKEPIQIIVFEDLKEMGYEMCDRTAGIDRTHCELVMTRLARLHAASMVLAQQDLKLLETFNFGFFAPNAKRNDIVETIFTEGLDYVLAGVRSWPGYEKIAEKMLPINNDVVTKLRVHCNASRPSGAMNVLNHGDLWVNNMMFKYDGNGRPIDLVFVDYQMSFYSSPGIDINYFLNTSPKIDVRLNDRAALIRTYREAMARALDEISSGGARGMGGRTVAAPSEQMILDEIKSREFFGFMAAVGILPIVLMDKEMAKGASMEALTVGDSANAMKTAMYTNPMYVTAMKHIVKRFEECVDFATVL